MSDGIFASAEITQLFIYLFGFSSVPRVSPGGALGHGGSAAGGKGSRKGSFDSPRRRRPSAKGSKIVSFPNLSLDPDDSIGRKMKEKVIQYQAERMNKLIVSEVGLSWISRIFSLGNIHSAF